MVKDLVTKVSIGRRETCRLCGGGELHLALPLAPSALADAFVPAERLGQPQGVYPLDLHLCRSCGHLQLLTVIDPNVLFGDYLYETSTSPGLTAHFASYADDVVARFGPSQGSLVVDIGSNDGTLLRFLQARGMRVLGVDGAVEIARKANTSGVETLAAFFTSALARGIREARGPARVVTANNVFAHADDLGDVAEGVRLLLATDGVFQFEVSYLVDMIDNMVFDWIYHEHLCYHAIQPLRTFFNRHGLELIDVRRVSTKGGSLRGTAQLIGGPRPVAHSVDEFCALEESRGLTGLKPYQAFSARIEDEKRRLHDLLRGPIRQGKSIAGFGASATGTTLVHHFELGDILSMIVDDSPARHGLYSPGHHIPVVEPQALYERKPDYVVVLAWRFAEPIVRRHRRYLEAGGRFVVPLPRASIIER